MRTMQLYLPQRYPPIQLYRQALNKLIRPEFGVSDGVGLVFSTLFSQNHDPIKGLARA